MKLLLVTDIFGNTEAISDLLTELESAYQEIEIIDPYNGDNHYFENEEVAYRKFSEVCCICNYSNKLEEILKKQSSSVDVIGFSVGATAAWEMTSRNVSKKIRQAVCFYGSRIREKTEINPKCKTTLIFPKYETNFDVEEVIKIIEAKKNTETVITNYLHGFMNIMSYNYSKMAYDKYIKLIKEKAA